MERLPMIATRILSQVPRSTIGELQRRLANAQQEAVTGRHYDPGLALGSKAGSAISLRLELDVVAADLDRVAQAAVRADVTQASLTSLSSLAQDFRAAIAGARGAENGKSLAATAAHSSAEAMQALMSTTYEGRYIFGGLMTETSPLQPYETGSRQAIADAFEAEFGFTLSDPAAAGLTRADVEGFLDGALSSLFSEAEWQATWSAASKESMQLRLGIGGTVDLHTTASRPFARLLAASFSMTEVLGQSNLSEDVFQVVADRSLSLALEAQLQVHSEQAYIGAGQARLRLAGEAASKAKDGLTSAISALEGVDAYEAASRVTLLMTQLEASYALTGRLSRMSILSYI